MAYKCSDGAPFESLRFCTGQKVLPGIRNHVYFINKNDITTWPKLNTQTDVGDENSASYLGNFVLAADKKWQRIDLVIDKGNVECETQGDAPSVTFQNKLTATHPLIDGKATSFARFAVDADLVYLVPQRDGKYRVLGNEMFATVSKPKLSTGEGSSTAGGLEVEITVTDVCPAPFYAGTIDTEDEGVISGTDGSTAK